MSDNCTVAPANGRITGTQIRIVAVVVLGAFLALLNQTVMSPALPVIMSDFAIDASTAQWIMSIYPLVSGIMVPVSAFLIDKFSTRALFFGATLVFALGTLLCAAAPDFLFLIIGRVLQAAGSGVLMPLVSVVPMLVFPVEKRGTAMGMAGIVMSAGPAVGPVVGGAVIDTYGWRTMIGAIVPLAILVLVLGVFMLKNVGELKNPKLDLPSVVLSTIAFGGLLYARGAIDGRHAVEQRRLARARSAHDANKFAAVDGKADVVERAGHVAQRSIYLFEMRDLQYRGRHVRGLHTESFLAISLRHL